MLTIRVAPLGSSPEVGLEGGRVHGHEHVGRVAGRQDVVVGEVDLEGRDAGERAGGGADLGREVREGREVVADERARSVNAVAGELHAVAGVAGEADDHPFQLLRHMLGSGCH